MAIVVAAITSITTDSGNSSDFVTNDRTLTISGGAVLSLLPSTLGIWLHGGAFATPTLVGTVFIGGLLGVTIPWSFDLTTSSNVNAQSLADGTYTITVADTLLPLLAFDSDTLVVDAALPTAVATVTALSADSGIAGDFVTNVAAQTVSGTFTGALAAGETIQVSINGTTWINAISGVGTWTASGVTLSPGSGTLSVRTIDTAANVTAGVGHGYTLDAAAPAAPTIGTIGGADSTVSSLPGDATIAGTAEANSTVTVKSGATTLGTATVDGSGNWSFALSGANLATIGEGAGKTVTATASDMAGNTSPTTTSLSFTVDTTAPAVATVVVALSADTGTPGDFITNVAAQTVSGTFTGTLAAGDKIQASLDGATWIDATAGAGTWAAAGIALVAGAGTISVRAVDALGNAVSGTGHSYVLDVAAPGATATVVSLSADSGVLGDFVTNVASQTVSGSFTGALAAGEKIQVSVDGTSWIDATAGVGTWSASGVTLLSGSGTLSVRTIDLAANVTAGVGHGYSLLLGGPLAVATVTSLGADSGLAGDFITNVASQTVNGSFTGALAAGQKIQVSVDGTSWIDATAGAGTWSASGVALLPGSGTVLVRTVDLAANATAGIGHGYVLDTTAPGAPGFASVGGGDSVVSGQPGDATISGTAEAGSTVAVKSGATTLGTATVDGGGNWSLSLTPGNLATIGQGSGKTVTATATDVAGNISAGATSAAFTIDTVAPTALAVVVALSVDTGTVGDFVTNVATQTVSGTFTGTLGAGEKIQVSVDGTSWVDATAGAGTWSVAGVILAPGAGLLQVRTIDAVANATPGTGHAYTLDLTAPGAIATVGSLSADTGALGDFVTSVASQTVSGTFTGALAAGEKIQVSVDGTTWIDAAIGAGIWTASGVTLTPGTGVLSVRTIDLAANVTLGVSHGFTLILGNPSAVATVTAISVDSGTAGDFITNVAAQTVSGTFTGSLGGGEKIQVSADGATWIDATAGAGTWSASGLTLAAGAGTLSVRTIDLASNITAGVGHSYVLDTSPPAAPVIGTIGGADNTVSSQPGDATVTGTAEPGSSVTIKNGATTLGTATADGAGNWSYTLTPADLATIGQGSGKTVTATATDAAGNSSPGTTASFTVDTQAPPAIATVTALSADTGTPGDFITNVALQTVSGTFTGTLGAGEKIQASANGTTWIDAAAGAGTWSASGVTLQAGSGTLSVRTIDAAANTTAGFGHAYTLDAVVPPAAATVTALSADTGVPGDFVTSVAAQTVSGTFTGTLGAGEKIQVSANGTTWIDATAGAGTWSAGGVTLSPGSGTLSVRTIDAAANITAGTGQAYTLTVGGPLAVATVASLGADSGIAGDFITNVALQTVSGTFTGALAAGEKIQVSVDGTTWIDAVAGAGTWSAGGVTLASGSGVLSVRTINVAADVTAGVGHAYVLDTTAPATPVIGMVGGADNTVSGQPGDATVAGTAEAGSVVTVKNGATTLGTTTADAGGAWSYTLTPADLTAIGQGAGKAVTATATDVAGNSSPATTATFTIDTLAPSAIATVGSLSADTGVAGDFITSIASQTVSGTVAGALAAGEKIQVSANGTTWIDATTGTGTWSASGVILQSGNGTLSVRTIDAASNVTSGVGHAYTLDTTAPTSSATVTALSVDTGTPGDFVTSVASQTVSGTFTGALAAGEKIQVSTNGTTWIDAAAGAGTWSASGVTLAPGSGTLSVRTVDAAANVTAGAGHGYTLMVGGPSAVATVGSLSADSGVAGDFITNVAGQTVSGSFTGSLAAGEKIQVSVNGTTWIDATAGAGTWSASGVTLQPGAGTLSVRTTDMASNVTSGVGHAYVLDTTAPAAPVIGSIGGPDNTVSSQPGDATVTGTAEADGTVTLKNGATTLGTVTVDAGGTWSYTLTPADLATIGQGAGKLVTATATDVAGNGSAASSASFTVDTSAPTAIATVGSLSADTGIAGDFITSVATQTVSGTFTGTLGAGEKIQVSANGTTWIDATTGAGTWSASGVILQSGSGTLSVRTIDTAINATAGVGHAYTLDTGAPLAIATVTALSADTGTPGDFVTSVAAQTVGGTFAGTLGAGEKIQVSTNGTTWIDATAGAGTWSASGVTLSPGNGTLSVRTVDAAANVAFGIGHGYSLVIGGPSAVATVVALSADSGIAGDFITNVASQTVSGTFTGALGAGEKIQVSTNGTTWIDATAGAGTWSASGVTLQQGAGTLSVRTIDMAMNVTSGLGHAYVLDTTAPPAPAVGTVGGADNTVSGQPGDATVAGTAEAGSTVTVKNGTTTLGTVTADAGGNWSYALTPADLATIGQGSGKTVTATATDTAGNSSGATPASFTVDTVVPGAFATVTALSADTGVIGDFITSVAAQTVNGTFTGVLGVGEKIQVSAGGAIWVDATAGAGAWSANGVILQPGSGTLSVRTIDSASNATAGLGHLYVLDVALPTALATVTALSADTGVPGDFITAVASQTVSGTFIGVLNAGETIQVSADGVTWSNATTVGNTWSANGVTLLAGNGVLSVRTVDAAANVTAGNGHAYVLTVGGPAAVAAVGSLSADSGTPGDFITNVAAQTVSGTFIGALGAGDKIQASVDGVTWIDAVAGAGTWSASGIVLQPGAGTLSVRTINLASEITAGVGRAYVLDTTPPSPPVIGSVGGADNTVSGQPGDATVSGTAEAGSTITVKSGSTTLGTTTADSGGNWNYALTPADLTTIGQGTGRSVTATAADAAGNGSPGTSATFTVDTITPIALATVVSLSADTGTPGDFITNVAAQTVSGTFTGSLGAGEKIQVSANGTSWIDATAGANTWSANGVTLSPGTGTLSVRTIDVATNATIGTGHAYTLDGIAPSAMATVTALSADTGILGDFVTSVAAQTVSGTFAGTLGAGEKIQVSANGTTWVDAAAGAGTWSAAGVTLQPGSGILSVRTIDTAANVTTGTGHAFTLTVGGPSAVATVTGLSADTGLAGDFITSVALQTVSGTFSGGLAAGDKIQVSVNGTTWIDATAGAGTWSASGVSLLPGSGILSVRTIDLASDITAGVGRGYVLDMTAPPPPQVGLVGGADNTVSSQPGDSTIAGTAEAGSTVTVKSGSTTLGTVTADAGGAWSYTLTPADLATIGQGAGKTVTATATDAAGNSSAATSASFTVDTSAPAVLATITSLSNDTGTPGDFVTSVALQTVSGTFAGSLAAGEKIQVSVNGTTWIDAAAGAGAWSAGGVVLLQGTGTLSVRTIDMAVNITAGMGHGYTLDSAAPSAVATITSLSADTGTPGDFVTSVALQTVSGTFGGALGSGEKIQVSVNGTTWIDAAAAAGTWSASGVALTLGSGILSVRTLDIAANVTAGIGHSYVLTAGGSSAVATVVSLSADTGMPGDFITSIAAQSVTGTFAGTLGAGEKIQVSANGTTWIDAAAAAGTWTASGVTLQPGVGTLSVRTIDAAFDITAGVGRTYLLDTTAPGAPAIGPVGGVDNTVSGQPGDATVTGTAEAGTTITVKNGATTLGTTTTDAGGNWTYTLTPTDLATIGQGSGKTISATATDAAGNGSTASTSAAFAIDTMAPTAVATVTALSADTGTPGDFITSVAAQTVSGTFAGTLGAGEKIQVSVNGTTWTDATTGAGTWSANGVTLSPGSGTLAVRTIDAASNATAGVGHGYTLDISGSLPVAAIGPTTISRVEGDSGVIPYMFTVTLDHASASMQTLNWSVSGGTASATDFQGGAVPSGTVTFAAGETTKSVIVNVKGDTQVETDETFLVTLSTPSPGVVIGTASASGTIVDDDGTIAQDRVHNDAYIVLQNKSLNVSAASGVLFNDEGASPQSAVHRTGPESGMLNFNSDGRFNYNAFNSFAGIDSFSYEALADGTLQATTVLVYVVPTISNGTTTTLNLLALDREEQIAATYVTFFGRGADAGGFAFWVNEFAINETKMSQHDLFANIASSFAVSDEAKALYPFLAQPDGATDAQIQGFLNTVYDNLFERTPDAGGLAYWTNQIKQTLASGAFVGHVLIQIINGAQETIAGLDISTLMGKVAVNLEYVQQQEQLGSQWTFADDGAEARALMNAVSDNRQSVLTGVVQAQHLVLADV